MSRAFVREEDTLEPATIPELQSANGPSLVTPEGYDLIAKKVDALEAAMRMTSQEDERQRLQRDLRYWASSKENAQILQPTGHTEVGFGCRVTLQRNGRKQTLTLVGADEADPGAGRINWRAPLALALAGARPGETITLDDRDPPETVTVISVE